MKIPEYIRKIKTSLGVNSDLIDIELDDTELEYIVKDSLDDMKPYISTTKMMTLPFQKVIDLKDKGVYVIYQVYRGTPGGAASSTSGVSDEALIFGGGAGAALMTGSYNYSGHNIDMFDQVNLKLAANMYQNALRGLNDIDFTYSDNILYVDSTRSSPTITIEYVPTYDSVEELTDPYWERKLKDLALANTKIALGRIRSKYVLEGNSYSLDGQILLDEGKEERLSIMDGLVNSASEVLQILD